jgi:hypothetical protein
MKKFKEFESMVTDDDRDSSSIDFLPKHNPVVQQNAKSYVDQIIQGNDLKLLYRAAGEEPPKNIDSMNMDDIYDELKQKAIEYFIENPEAIGKDIPMNKYKVNGGDGISRTNNLGGALHANSPRVGESKTEITISPDEMLYFNTEEPLIELIRNGKIELGNGVVHYDTSDQETKNILDIYLEIDGSATLEESLEYLKYTDRKKSSLVNLGNCGINFNLNENNIKHLSRVVESYEEAFLFDILDESLIDKTERVTKSVFRNYQIKTSINIHEISSETSHILNINEGRYQVLTLDIVNEDYKTKVNLVKSVSDWMIASIVDIKKSIKDKNGKVTECVNHLEGQRNLTFICENKFENSGLKEFLKKIWESL